MVGILEGVGSVEAVTLSTALVLKVCTQARGTC